MSAVVRWPGLTMGCMGVRRGPCPAMALANKKIKMKGELCNDTKIIVSAIFNRVSKMVGYPPIFRLRYQAPVYEIK